MRILDEEPDLGADAALVDSLTASVLDNVTTVLRVLELQPDPETVRAPAAAVDYARRLAQHGVPISALLRTYRLGQAAFQQVVLAEIGRANLDAATVAAAAETLSTVAFAYVDRISEQVVAAYQQERDDWMRNRTAARTARVTSLAGGHRRGPHRDREDPELPARPTARGAGRMEHVGARRRSARAASSAPSPRSVRTRAARAHH